jgi:ParB family chromosome partitioning protein
MVKEERMESEQIRQIPLEQIEPHPGNRRVGGFDKGKLEQLAESIRAVGVQQPAVVRKAGENGHYQLVAGERRWRAAKLAGLEVLPCVVRELDDLQVLRIQTIENLQREDVHPLDEADGYARLIELAKYDVESVAQEVGKSASYVYQRLKLRELIPEARKLLIDGTITAGHAILIARLTVANQKEASKYCQGDRYHQAASVRGLTEWIFQNVYMSLARASFKKDDEELVPRAGPCTTCPKRSGYQPALFADVGKDDLCLDRLCFNSKLDALVARKAQELKDAGVVRVHGRGGGYTDERKDPTATNTWEFEPAKKGEKGAVPLLTTTGSDRGQVSYGKKKQSNRYRTSPAEKAREERSKAEEKEDQRKRRSLVDQILEQVTGEMKKGGRIPTDVLRVMATRALHGAWGDKLSRLESALGLERGKKPQVEGHAAARKALAALPDSGLALFLVRVLLEDIQDHHWNYADDPDRLAPLAKARGIKPAPKPKETQEKAKTARTAPARARARPRRPHGILR